MYPIFAAIARIVVASTPSATNSSRAASRIAWRVSALCRSRRASEAVRMAEVVMGTKVGRSLNTDKSASGNG